jgi:hypothetical protein
MNATSITLLRRCSAIVAVFVVTLSPYSASGQSQKQLELTIKIVEQSYCSIDQKTSVQLRLKLRYTNLSPQRLIVYKGHDLFFQTKIRPENNAATPASGVLLLNMRYFDEEMERIDARSPSRVFVKLAPGAAFERELMTGVGVADNSAAPSENTVPPGAHILQLIVSTWYQSPKLADKLRQQWQREGLLWSQPLYSVPVKLKIEKPPTISPCR